MASQPPVMPDIISPQSPPETPARPIPAEAPPPHEAPETVPDDGGDVIEPGQTPDEVPPEPSRLP